MSKTHHYLCSCVCEHDPTYAACIHACTTRLCVYADLFMRTHICSWVMRTQFPTYVHVPPIRNPILNLVSSVSYPNANLTPFFSSFCRLCPHFPTYVHLYSRLQVDYLFTTREVYQCHSSIDFGWEVVGHYLHLDMAKRVRPVWPNPFDPQPVWPVTRLTRLKMTRFDPWPDWPDPTRPFCHVY